MEQSRIETLLKAANSSSESDTSVNSAERTFLTEADAREFFRSVRENLLWIPEWRNNSAATSYDLFDETGQPSSSEQIEVGKFIRIDLRGSGKYDWVRVVEIVDTQNEAILKVRTAHDPTDPDGSRSISHFFGPEAENNFCVQLKEKSVVFSVIGLNEKQNTEFTDGIIESTRNAAVANFGYYTGLQKAVWKDFAANFLKTDEEKAD